MQDIYGNSGGVPVSFRAFHNLVQESTQDAG
jgi:hypothetical protein